MNRQTIPPNPRKGGKCHQHHSTWSDEGLVFMITSDMAMAVSFSAHVSYKHIGRGKDHTLKKSGVSHCEDNLIIEPPVLPLFLSL